jgi:hypothetical protein
MENPFSLLDEDTIVHIYSFLELPERLIFPFCGGWPLEVYKRRNLGATILANYHYICGNMCGALRLGCLYGNLFISAARKLERTQKTDLNCCLLAICSKRDAPEYRLKIARELIKRGANNWNDCLFAARIFGQQELMKEMIVSRDIK